MSDAVVDESGTYRYLLWRAWPGVPLGPRGVLWVMLNPSTADAVADDPTIKRCIGFSAGWGFGELEVVNLFAFRTSKPSEIPRDITIANGPDNDRHIREAIRSKPAVVAAWGSPGPRWLRDMVNVRVEWLLSETAAKGIEIQAIGTCGDGMPKHPLARGRARVPDAAILGRWRTG